MNLATDILTPACAWTAWNVAVATGAARLPLPWFARRRRAVARPSRRRKGAFHVRRWKRLLPDAGAVLPGATAKRHLEHLDGASLVRYAAEARRSEIVHWSSAAFVASCFAWWPAVVIGPMFAVAVIINLPCVLALRDSQARIDRILARAERGNVRRGGSTAKTAG